MSFGFRHSIVRVKPRRLQRDFQHSGATGLEGGGYHLLAKGPYVNARRHIAKDNDFSFHCPENHKYITNNVTLHRISIARTDIS
jgi:hypothetical protein